MCEAAAVCTSGQFIVLLDHWSGHCSAPWCHHPLHSLSMGVFCSVCQVAVFVIQSSSIRLCAASNTWWPTINIRIH